MGMELASIKLLKPEHCKSCIGWSWGCDGFVPAHGTGENGVLVVLEAAGEHEANEGIPTVGKAGYFLWQNLQRVGIDREGFKVHNVLSCQPPGNKLAGMPYEEAAITHCAPLLDATISDMLALCQKNGRNFTIVTLGRIAFKRIMGLTDKDPLLKKDYLCYPFWNEKYQAWVIAADHPSYLMRGNNHLLPTLQFTFKRALEIAEHGFKYHRPIYLRDPDPETFAQWVGDYLAYASQNTDSLLAFDIETPHKQGKDEEEVSKEDDDDFTILRCSFAYKAGEAISVPWRAEYRPYLEELFSSSFRKTVWNCPTPDQKILTADLKWIPVGDLKVGDKLVGFDENIQEDRKIRRFKSATVTNAELGFTGHVFKVNLSDGSFVKVTAEHQWLLRLGQAARGYGHRYRGYSWVRTDELKTGSEIRRIFNVWNTEQTYNAGWLAGFFDGEGSLSFSPAVGINVSQKIGPTLSEVKDRLVLAEFKSSEFRKVKREKDAHIGSIHLLGGKNEAAKFLGSIRPNRLLNKFEPEQLGGLWCWDGPTIRVTSIEDLGEQPIVRLSTDTHTYMLEGFGAHNCNYDFPRISVQMPIHGDVWDAMLMWHVLNSALPKGLGFVTPFYCQDMPAWKHLSNVDPAGYNAQDSDALLRCTAGIRNDLKRNNQWHVFESHVIRLDQALKYMSEKGVLLDQIARNEAEKRVQDLLDTTEIKMEASVPKEVRKYKIYKKTPKSTEGMEQIEGVLETWVCRECGEIKPRKGHSKLCQGEKTKWAYPAMLWAKPLPFKISKVGLTSYQQALRHQAVISRKERKVTFDESAIMKLIKQYPNDKLYPLILEHREQQKLLGTYIGVTQENGFIRGGMPIGPDGRIHTLFVHNPSTLRLASQNPNLQNLPRPKGEQDLASIIRNLIIAPDGSILYARDYSGIEAILVGYFAQAPSYIRLSKIDVHSFYTAYCLNALDGRVSTADLPLISWPDEKLIPHLAWIKKEFKKDRNELYKHLVHGGNFAQTPKGAAEKIFKETGVEFPVKKIARVMEVYFELFPEIKRWHQTLLLQAEKDGFLRNPFGYVHRFNRVFSYHKEFGKWQRKPGDDANRVIAFLPQSTAAGIIKEAILRLFFNRFEEAGQFLRLQIHDEIFLEIPLPLVEQVDRVVQEEMERPVPELALPKSYKMGEYLNILTEGKKGMRWAGMH